MANGYFANFTNLIWGGGTHSLPDFTSDTIEVSLVDAADITLNLATMQDETDIAAGIVDTEALASKTVGSVAAGTFDAADTTFTAVDDDQCENLIIHKGAGTAGTDPLIASIDTATGLPVTPNTGDIVVEWNASGILTA